jgi:hypothetical protein
VLTPEARKQIMALLPSNDPDDMAAINAILASAFYLKGTTPITKHGKHTFKTQFGEKEYDEHPGQLRGENGWLTSPQYLSSMDEACKLVKCALGDEWIIEVYVRADGSCAQLHEFPLPCRKTKTWRSEPGLRGAAAAIVRCVLDATDQNATNQGD